MIRLEPLARHSADAIDALLDAAFEPDRRGRTAYRIRLGMAWLTNLSFAALDEQGRMVGLVQSWPVALHSGEDAVPLIMVGPVAVLPDVQKGGHGRALMDHLIAEAERLTDEPLMMIGDPEYYQRFWGFSADETGAWEAPGPFETHRLLARQSRPSGHAVPRAGMLGPRLPVALPVG